MDFEYETKKKIYIVNIDYNNNDKYVAMVDDYKVKGEFDKFMR